MTPDDKSPDEDAAEALAKRETALRVEQDARVQKSKADGGSEPTVAKPQDHLNQDG